MNQTPNYQLNQWEAEDIVRREDFNEDNAKTDAAIKAVDQRVDALSAGKADKTTLAAKAEIVTGSYTGNGAAERFLNLGFTPKAVYICTSYGGAFNGSNGSHTCYGGLALPGLPVAVGDHICLEIKTGGVGLYHWTQTSSTFYWSYTTNAENCVYYYVALK